MSAIPTYPESRRIGPDDREAFEKDFSDMQPRLSEFTFTNLFIWGRPRNYMASMKDGHILVSMKKGGRRLFFQPIGPEPWKVMETMLSEEDVEFARVGEEAARKLEGRFAVTADRDNDDYVYRREDLAELRGAKYYPKRSFARRAMKYSPVVLKGKEIDMEKAARLEMNWCDTHGCDDDEDLRQEEAAIFSFFVSKVAPSTTTCVALSIDGEIAAFASGEELNKETFVVHFEKADTRYTGMYQLINQEFAKAVPEKYRYINRQQDLGVEGLRKAKESYYPDHMVRKFTVKRKQ